MAYIVLAVSSLDEKSKEAGGYISTTAMPIIPGQECLPAVTLVALPEETTFMYWHYEGVYEITLPLDDEGTREIWLRLHQKANLYESSISFVDRKNYAMQEGRKNG